MRTPRRVIVAAWAVAALTLLGAQPAVAQPIGSAAPQGQMVADGWLCRVLHICID